MNNLSIMNIFNLQKGSWLEHKNNYDPKFVENTECDVDLEFECKDYNISNLALAPKCIPFTKVCDGIKHCRMGEDEGHELCGIYRYF